MYKVQKNELSTLLNKAEIAKIQVFQDFIDRKTLSQLWLLITVSAIQSCQTLCDPTDCSPPGSFAHETLQAGILGWVAMNHKGRVKYNSKVERCVTSHRSSGRRLCVTIFKLYQVINDKMFVLFASPECFVFWRLTVLLEGNWHWLNINLTMNLLGEGNGNLRQYSCQENPRDRRAW